MTMRPMIECDGPRPTEDDIPPPTWERLRFSADTVARCFGSECELPFETRDRLADDINAILDRDHNRRSKVFTTLDLSQARNVSLDAVRAARWCRVMDAAGALYQKIEVSLEYGPLDEPWPEIARLLAAAGAVFPRKYPPPRGRPRSPWHRPGAEIARLVFAALRGRPRRRAATNPEGATAEISARIVSGAFGVPITAEQFALAVKGLKRSRRKRQPSRIRVLA